MMDDKITMEITNDKLEEAIGAYVKGDQSVFGQSDLKAGAD